MRSDWPPGRARGFIFLARDFSLSFVLFFVLFQPKLRLAPRKRGRKELPVFQLS